jgi:hypothetical protein
VEAVYAAEPPLIRVLPSRICPFELALNWVYGVPIKINVNPMSVTGPATSSLVPVNNTVAPVDMSSKDPEKELLKA